MELGAVGTASSHLAHFARELRGTARLTRALPLPGDPPALPRGVRHCAAPAAFSEGLGGVLLLSRDGREHLEQARPFLEAGLAVFVDKPLACDAASARELLALGRVTSFSTLRFLPEVAALRAQQVPVTEVRTPADPASSYAGRWFLGIHGAELACALQPGLELRAVERHGERLTLRLEGPQGPLALQLDPAADGFELRHAGGVLRLDDSACYRYGARRLEAFFVQGVVPLTAEEMLAPVALLETALRQV
ncbi:hypothetical protein HNR42_000921 [Deinobacterium chartae]|uniref:Gfo/Idh/MocA-like oxidoreductase N-terminal domain-containing protein n=1 Tax=Deinobacterium chartae TaxID=521158 RepID=A0A841HXY3_9DEIO|nr:hypothetical protein [Deinobacterium chartae]MBB6097504.1 hypothetical protein [Deinobacterium chartae]